MRVQRVTAREGEPLMVNPGIVEIGNDAILQCRRERYAGVQRQVALL